jgi:hypothetical protein
MIEQTDRSVEVRKRKKDILVEVRHPYLKNLRHAGLEDVLGLLGFFGGEGNDMSTLCRYEDGAFVAIDAVNEWRSGQLYLVLAHEVLKIYFSHDFAVLNVPMD